MKKEGRRTVLNYEGPCRASSLLLLLAFHCKYRGRRSSSPLLLLLVLSSAPSAAEEDTLLLQLLLLLSLLQCIAGGKTIH